MEAIGIVTTVLGNNKCTSSSEEPDKILVVVSLFSKFHLSLLKKLQVLVRKNIGPFRECPRRKWDQILGMYVTRCSPTLGIEKTLKYEPQ